MQTNPFSQYPQALERAAGVKLMIFDVDGVLTDGGLFYGHRDDGTSGEALKRFDSLDGHGIKLLAQAGIATAIISGRKSQFVSARASDLGIVHVYQGVDDKLLAFDDLLSKTGVTATECGYMGDDWPDLPLLDIVRFSACPAQAHVAVKARVRYVTQASGGQGAAREVCDLLLQASGQYAPLLAAAVRRS